MAQALQAQAATLSIATEVMLPAPAALPGRPERPALISPAQVPQRSVHSVEGRAALIHVSRVALPCARVSTPG